MISASCTAATMNRVETLVHVLGLFMGKESIRRQCEMQHDAMA